MHLYCTLFDIHYATRGLALHGSLQRHRAGARLAVLCLDDATHGALAALAPPGMELVSLADLERFDPALARARADRGKVEYYFTCKPALMRFLSKSHPDADWITYLDSDLFYFSDPAPLESTFAASAVALTPHRFPPRLAGREQYGRFNAGWVSARSGGEGARFVDWWRERCLEWCGLQVEAERFGDQKYLDKVPALFSGVAVLDEPGANLAPWNVDGRQIDCADGSVSVHGRPLFFYHFHGVRKVLGALYDSGLEGYRVPMSTGLRQGVYRPYLARLAQAQRQLDGMAVPAPGDPAAPALRAKLRKLKRAVEIVASGTGVLGP